MGVLGLHGGDAQAGKLGPRDTCAQLCCTVDGGLLVVFSIRWLSSCSYQSGPLTVAAFFAFPSRMASAWLPYLGISNFVIHKMAQDMAVDIADVHLGGPTIKMGARAERLAEKLRW